MRKWRMLVCLLIFAVTIPTAWHLKRTLPSDTQPMIEKKYGGWSGVLRLWICETWKSGGSISTWINRSTASFEKRHPGVYVQPEYVDTGALSAEGLVPPDLVLFAPGGADAGLFAPLDIDPPLRDGLPHDDRAAPVLTGGYLWAYNAAMIDGVPNSWRDIASPIAVPSDDSDHLWSAALLALCSSRYSEDNPSQETAPLEDVELGLPDDRVERAPAPGPSDETLNCLLPEGFAPSDDAWQAFINGDAAAMPVTPREIRRLEALSEQGKGPDWRLAPAGDAAFTDQVMYIGAANQDNPEKFELCRAFIVHLLDAECQGELHRAGAFSVTDADSGYAAGDDLRAMEQALRQKEWIVPGPFDADWREDASDIVREFWRKDRSPSALLAALSERIRQ